MMPSAGSRFNLLAQADRRTGSRLGYFGRWRLEVTDHNARYERQRAEWRLVTPLISAQEIADREG